MKIENEKLGFSFELPDRLNVRQQLEYKGRLGVGIFSDSPDTYLSLWRAAVPLLEKWKCDTLPDLAALDLDKETRVQVADIVSAVGMTVFNHTRNQEDVEKN